MLRPIDLNTTFRGAVIEASVAIRGWYLERVAIGRPYTVPFDRVPQNLAEMRAAMENTQAPYPVSTEGCEDCIYWAHGDGQTTNMIGRYHHDTWHVRLGADVDYAGELAVAKHAAMDPDLNATTAARQLLWIDAAAQTVRHNILGGHVGDQLAFVLAVWLELKESRFQINTPTIAAAARKVTFRYSGTIL